MPPYTTIIKRGLLVVGIVILILFIATLDFQSIVESMQALKQSALLLLVGITLLLTFLNIAIKAYRWKILVYKTSGVTIPILFSFNSILAGVAAASFLPGRIEMVKPLLLKTEYDVPLSKSFSALVLDRVLDLLFLILILAVCLLFIPLPGFISFTAIAILAGMVIIATLAFILFPQPILTLFNRIIQLFPFSDHFKAKTNHFMAEIILSFTILASRKAALLLGISSLLANVLEVVRFYYLLQLLGIPASLALTGFVFTVSILLGIITAIPGGIGVTELSAATIIEKTLFTPGSLTKTAVLLDRIISYYFIILLGALILIFQGYFLKVKRIVS